MPNRFVERHLAPQVPRRLEELRAEPRSRQLYGVVVVCQGVGLELEADLPTVLVRRSKNAGRSLYPALLREKASNLRDPANGLVDAVDVFVDDRNLVELLREIELPFAVREGKPGLAGSYAGLPPEEVFLPSPRLFGEPTTDYDHEGTEGKISVLGCVCGEPSCWPFQVKIALRDDVVIWSDFEQPHRSVSDGTNLWSYDGLRPFLFDRAQYLSALSRTLSGA